MARRGAKRVERRRAPGRVPGAGRASGPAGKAGGVADRLPAASAEEVDEAKRSWERGVVSRGEAARPGEPLAPGMTHEIVGRTPDGRPILKRKRFSLR